MKLVSEEAVPKPEIAARPARPAGGLNFTSLAALYVLTIRQHVHGRRWLVMAMLFLLPAGLAVLIRSTALSRGADSRCCGEQQRCWFPGPVCDPGPGDQKSRA